MSTINPTTFFDTRYFPLDIQRNCLMPYVAGGASSDQIPQAGMDNLKAYAEAVEPKDRAMFSGYSVLIEIGFYHKISGSSVRGPKSNLCENQNFSVTFSADAHGNVKRHEFHYMLASPSTSSQAVFLSFQEFVTPPGSSEVPTTNTAACTFIPQGGAVQDIACSDKGYLFVATEFNLCVYRMSDTNLGQLLYKHDYRFEQIEWDNTHQVLKGRSKNSLNYDTELHFKHRSAMPHTGNPKANLWEKIKYLANEIFTSVLKEGFDTAWSFSSMMLYEYAFTAEVIILSLILVSVSAVPIVLGALAIHFFAMPVIIAIGALAIAAGGLVLGSCGLIWAYLTVIGPICFGSLTAYEKAQELYHTRLFA